MKRQASYESPMLNYLTDLVQAFAEENYPLKDDPIEGPSFDAHAIYAIVLIDFASARPPRPDQFQGLVIGMKTDDEILSLAWNIYRSMQGLSLSEAVDFYCDAVNRFLDYACFYRKGIPVLPMPNFRIQKAKIIELFTK